MQFKAFGDRAILIELEQKIDPRVNEQVIQIDRALRSAQFPGVTFSIPAYCSLTIGYDPSVTTFEGLRETIRSLAEQIEHHHPEAQGRTLRIPVCYQSPHALDMEEVARHTGLRQADIIDRHVSCRYRVYMLGFLPGFPYMGRLPEQLACPRKATPRLRVPARSVGLAGFQTGIYPSEGPGGWQIIGRTPLPVFDKDKETPFLFQPGDHVKFYPVSKAKFEEIEGQIANGTFQQEEIYE